MKFFFADYELKGKIPSDTRNGALLKIHFENGRIGYADCHPWKELGDKPLSEQLSLLSRGKFTPLTNQSLKFAELDGKARANGMNLFSNLSIPPSHWFLKNFADDVPEGFALCKVKLGKDPEKELKQLPVFYKRLPEKVSVRLDFNNRTDQQTFKRYLDVLQHYTQQIDLIEDPFAYQEKAWEEIQSEYSLKLASDYKSEFFFKNVHSHSITVIKPAVQDHSLITQKDPHQVFFTSYLDHPIGQVAAAHTAALAAGEYPEKVLTCGLLTHCIYQTNPYSEDLAIKGDRLVPPTKGTGFGFDEQLHHENWIELK